MRPAARAPAGRDGIVGRAEELAALGSFVREATDGPAFLVVRGEPGIGKTTLWRHAVEEAEVHGFTVLTARPSQSEARLAFTGLTDLLDHPAVEDALLGLALPQREALEVALLRRSATGGARDWRAVGLGLLAVFRHLAAAGPVVVAIDDLQWADPSTARVVGFALRRMRAEPLRLVTAMRDPSPDAATPRTAPGAVLLEGLEVVDWTVRPLDVTALGHLLRSQLHARFSERALVELHAAAGGNPFFALEIGRATLRGGQRPLSGQPLPLPRSLRELVSDRVSALSDAALEVLLVAAAVSRPRRSVIVAAVGDAARVTAGLEEAERADVIRSAGDRISFSHPLLASTIYAGAADADRRRLHRTLADVVDDQEERVHHLAVGTIDADEDVASALEVVAQTTRARGAPDAAAALAEEAVRLTPPEARGDGRRRTLAAAEYHFGSGNMRRAHALVAPLVASTSPGPERARVLLRLGELEGQEFGFQAATASLNRALADAGGDRRLEVEIRLYLGFADLVGGDIPAGGEQARLAFGLAEDIGDIGLLSEAMSEVILFDFLQGRGVREDLIAREKELAASAARQQIDPRPGLVHLRTMPAIVLKWADRLDESRARLLAVQKRIIDLGDVSWMPYQLYHLSELECWAGDYDLADHYADEGIETARQSDQEEVLTANLYSKALVQAHRGDLEAARETAESGLELCQKTGNIPVSHLTVATLAFIDLSAGDYEGVRRRLRPLVDGLRRIGLGEPGVVRYVPDAVEALVALGDLSGAEEILAPFEERARVLDRVWALATGKRSRALVVAAHGDLAAAAVHAKRSLEHHERLGQPFELGRSLLVAGSIARRTKRQAEARRLLGQAIEIFDRLGARVFAARARTELARVPGRAPSGAGLTETERQVADLVAAGLTNREVAERLFVSVRTVESNLSRTYAKLGIRTRTELSGHLPPR